MTDNRPANVQGPVLKWARERWGVTREEAAAALEVDAAVIDAWEAGEAGPTPEQAFRMSDVYNISFGDLLASAPPEEPQPRDFRVAGGSAPARAAEVCRALALARADQREASYLAGDLGKPVPPPLPVATCEADPVQLAKEVAGLLCDDASTRIGTGGATGQLWRWRDRVERLGIVVFAFPLPADACRGISLWADDQVPTIVINSRETSGDAAFSVLHEFGHVLLRSSAICGAADDGDPPDEESFCNRFAAAVLESGGCSDGVAGRDDAGEPLDEDVLAAISQDRPSPDSSACRRAEAHRLGRGYTSLVLHAVEAGEIDEIDALHALGLDWGQVEGVTGELGLNDLVPAVLR